MGGTRPQQTWPQQFPSAVPQQHDDVVGAEGSAATAGALSSDGEAPARLRLAASKATNRG